MTKEEIDFFGQCLSKADAYMEFGVGGSTPFAVKHSNLKCLKGIDSSKEWIKLVSSQPVVSKGIEEGRVELLHVDIGPTGSWGYPTGNSTADRWPKYSSQTFGTCASAAQHRLVLVDGRFRVACFLKFLASMDPHETSQTRLLIHDYLHRAEYHVVEKFADVIEIHGTLALFQKKPEADMVALKETASKYEKDAK
eukprot:CAMPEP_0114678696 /NCGR_PEP_ID=MMETSP0191-20121206/52073_1 /TAXON_ID=126664 /ORGANISM="Sorites sp." /LENGTH=194 /DNA_ID=CAMNT_0001953111 /DNA_START=47 /DNA_END=631 /DNA_ORIENTATION=-